MRYFAGAGLLPLLFSLAGGDAPRESGPSPDAVPRSASASAAELRIVEEETLLAVVTRRAGLAARLAHDHLIRAGRYDARLVLDPEDPGGARFQLTLPARELVVDDGAWQGRVEDRLRELGLVDEPFQETGEGDREKIRNDMLASGQLDADGHPEIRLRTGEIRSRNQEEAFPWEAEVILTLRGESRVTWASARVEQAGSRILVEALGTFCFSDFGIEPFSAYLGLVRNRDPFHLYLRLAAEPRDAP